MSRDNKYQDFDAKIKGLLAGGTEEPPQQLWENIAARLEVQKSPATTTQVPAWKIWTRRSTYAVAAVAAVLLLFFFLHTPQNSVSPERIDILPAPEQNAPLAQVIEPSEKTEKEPKTIIEVVPAEPIETVVEATAAEPTGTPVQTAESVVPEVVPTEEESFELLEIEQEIIAPKKAGLKLSAHSNVMSNFMAEGDARNKGFHSQKVYNTLSNIVETGEVFYNIPLTFGFNVAYDINEKWSVGVGINYTHLSRHFAGTHNEYVEGILKSSTDYDKIYNIQQFIGIPITAYFHLVRSEQINFYVHAGLTIEKCLGNTWTAQARKLNYTEEVKGVQLGAGVGLGVDFLISPLFSIYLDPDLKYYFSLNQPESIRTRQPLMLGFELGLRFHL